MYQEVEENRSRGYDAAGFRRIILEKSPRPVQASKAAFPAAYRSLHSRPQSLEGPVECLLVVASRIGEVSEEDAFKGIRRISDEVSLFSVGDHVLPQVGPVPDVRVVRTSCVEIKYGA